MANRVIGLDIGSFAVRAVEMTVGGAQPVLKRFGQVVLPQGAMRDGEVVDVGAVAAAIRRLWSEGGFKGKRVVVGVANQRVIVRQADLPAMSEQDLRSALQFEAQELIPIPVEDAVLDFQVLEDVVGPEGEPRVRILLAAAQREMVRTQLAAVEGAGLGATAVDVVPFALVRVLGTSGDFLSGGAEAIVCVGGSVTNVVVHEQGVPRFVRILLVGSDDITEAIARELNIHVDEAEDLKRRADATSGDASVARAGEIVNQRLGPLVEEIRGSLDYYLAQAQSSPISRVVVTGGGSRLAGLMERLQSQLSARVEPARPLNGVKVEIEGISAAQLTDVEPMLAVPIGLALAGEVRRGVRRISLLPSEVAAGREQRRQVVATGAAVGGIAVVLLLLWAARAAQLDDERDKADDAEARTRVLQAQEARLRDTTTLSTDIASRRGQVDAVLSTDIAWTRLFQEIATVIPNDVWIRTFAGTKGAAAAPSAVSFTASGFDQTSTARWLLRLGELNSLTGLWVTNSTKTGQGAATLVNFTSDAKLTPEARSKRAENFRSGTP